MVSVPDGERQFHKCEGDLPCEGPDPEGISLCEEFEGGTLWVFGPGDTNSQVGYCPYCGYEARTVPTIVMLNRIGAD
jgi:hypothetical protein